MLNKHKFLVLGVISFVFINLFEAAQQHFYITRFNLYDGEVSYWELLQNHLSLWLIWSLTAIALYHRVKREEARHNQFDLETMQRYCLYILLSLISALCLISAWQLLLRGTPLITFFEFLQFYTYQKAALFICGYGVLIVLTHLHCQAQELAQTVVQLSQLKQENEQIYLELKEQELQDQCELLRIKTGNEFKLVPVASIGWIQADDYCVLIHTTEAQCYSLRKSMKAMAEELSDKGFARLHRNAIINLSQVSTFRFNPHPEVTLKQGTVIKIANSRVAQVRALLNPM